MIKQSTGILRFRQPTNHFIHKCCRCSYVPFGNIITLSVLQSKRSPASDHVFNHLVSRNSVEIYTAVIFNISLSFTAHPVYGRCVQQVGRNLDRGSTFRIGANLIRCGIWTPTSCLTHSSIQCSRLSMTTVGHFGTSQE